MGDLKGPVEWEGVPTCGGFHFAKYFQPHGIPAQLPSKNCREHDDEKAIGDVRNTWIARLKSLLRFSMSKVNAVTIADISVRT